MTLRVAYHVKTSSTAGNDSSDLWPEYLLVSPQLYNVHDSNLFPKFLLPRPQVIPVAWADRIQSNFFRRVSSFLRNFLTLQPSARKVGAICDSRIHGPNFVASTPGNLRASTARRTQSPSLSDPMGVFSGILMFLRVSGSSDCQ